MPHSAHGPTFAALLALGGQLASPAEAIDCYSYKHVRDPRLEVGAGRRYSKIVECPPTVFSCVQLDGFYTPRNVFAESSIGTPRGEVSSEEAAAEAAASAAAGQGGAADGEETPAVLPSKAKTTASYPFPSHARDYWRQLPPLRFSDGGCGPHGLPRDLPRATVSNKSLFPRCGRRLVSLSVNDAMGQAYSIVLQRSLSRYPYGAAQAENSPIRGDEDVATELRCGVDESVAECYDRTIPAGGEFDWMDCHVPYSGRICFDSLCNSGSGLSAAVVGTVLAMMWGA